MREEREQLPPVAIAVPADRAVAIRSDEHLAGQRAVQRHVEPRVERRHRSPPHRPAVGREPPQPIVGTKKETRVVRRDHRRPGQLAGQHRQRPAGQRRCGLFLVAGDVQPGGARRLPAGQRAGREGAVPQVEAVRLAPMGQVAELHGPAAVAELEGGAACEACVGQRRHAQRLPAAVGGEASPCRIARRRQPAALRQWQDLRDAIEGSDRGLWRILARRRPPIGDVAIDVVTHARGENGTAIGTEGCRAQVEIGGGSYGHGQWLQQGQRAAVEQIHPGCVLVAEREPGAVGREGHGRWRLAAGCRLHGHAAQLVAVQRVQAHPAVKTAGGDATVSAERGVPARTLVVAVGLRRGGALPVPDLQTAARAGGKRRREPAPVGAEAQMPHRARHPAQPAQQAATVAVEQVHLRQPVPADAGVAAGGDDAAVGRDRHRVQLALVAGIDRRPQDLQQTPAGGVPHARGLVRACSDRVAPGGIDVDARDRRAMHPGLDAQDRLARRRRSRHGRRRHRLRRSAQSRPNEGQCQ